jgi:hypothetical protein
MQGDTMREVIEDRLMHLDGNIATKADIQAVKADMRSLEAKLEAKIDMTETKLLLSQSNQKHDIVKWMIGLLLGQTALLLTILRVMGILK